MRKVILNQDSGNSLYALDGTYVGHYTERFPDAVIVDESPVPLDALIRLKAAGFTRDDILTMRKDGLI